jgi:hypothetical protein
MRGESVLVLGTVEKALKSSTLAIQLVLTMPLDRELAFTNIDPLGLGNQIEVFVFLRFPFPGEPVVGCHFL